MKVAVVGATGLVGKRMLQVLEERHFPVTELFPVASERSVGRSVTFGGASLRVMGVEEALSARPSLALFSAGSAASRELAPRFAGAGCRVVDNSSCWRMDPGVKLVVPEVNGDVLTGDDFIIANPNCSTIQMVLPLAPMHRRWRVRRIVVSTYQSVTGSGNKAVSQLEAERAGAPDGSYGMVYPYRIDLNVLPHIDEFLESGYTKEEMKMVHETRKILSDGTIGVSPTTVRVPVLGGHSEAVNVEFARDFDLREVRELMACSPGVILMDDPARNIYPMPLHASGRDEVFVGRFRRDPSVEHGLSFWCVADNIRKGAATNAVQIAELLLERGWI